MGFIPQDPKMASWPIILPLVWKGRAEKRHGGKSLCIPHYHLGLICALCQDFFATSVDTTRQHASSCEALTTKDKEWAEKEESKGDNGDANDGYLLREI